MPAQTLVTMSSASVSVPDARPEVLRAYWHLAAERQRVFFARLEGARPPWTDDPIISRYKFTNAYRASDRVSQFLIRDVIYAHELPAEDVLLRTVLFRLFSKESTWQALEAELGPITYSGFDAPAIARILERMIGDGNTIYTSAFILCANDAYGHRRKHLNHLALIADMFSRRPGNLPARVAGANGLQDLYESLLAYPLIGPFMAYQLAIDINYSELVDFSENEFTMPGPGALRGIAKCFSDTRSWKPQRIIHWMTDRQQQMFDSLELEFKDLWGRPLHAIDCQNLFCETDKYSRVAFPELASNRTRIKASFAPSPAPPIDYFYPPKWGINKLVEAARGERSRRTA